MSRRLIVRSETESDIIEAALWYEEHPDSVGSSPWKFAQPFSAQLTALFPKNRMRISPDVRRIGTRRFPYRIFYILRADAIVVFALVHDSRHERTWINRL